MTGQFRRGSIAAAKLSPVEVLEIRLRYANEGWTQGKLSREYQVSVGTIGRIVRGESWQQYQQTEHLQEGQHHEALEEQAESAVLTPEQQADMEAGLARLLQPEPPRADPYVAFRDKGARGVLELDRVEDIVKEKE